MTTKQDSMLGTVRQRVPSRMGERLATALSFAASTLVPAITLLACGSDPQDARHDGTSAALVAEFDLGKSQLPEGIAVGNGVPYVGFAVTGEIAQVDVAKGTATVFATLPKPVPGKGFMTGLSFSKQHPAVLYAALVSFAPEVQPGIYRVDESGGAASLFASDSAMVFPNGLVDDEDGNWFVTDSAAGALFKISASGETVEKWAADDLLVGDSEESCAKAAGFGLPFPIGANGIVRSGAAFYVTNTDKGLVARIPIDASGAAGRVTVFAGPDCSLLGGADGITGVEEHLVVANNFRNELVRIDSMGNVTALTSGAPLDFPATPMFDQGSLWVTNFAFFNAQQSKGTPGLVKLTGSWE